MFKISNSWYASPRWSWEFLDCSMPMTFDQYSNCWFWCFYCFSAFQRWVWEWKNTYYNKEVKAVKLHLFKKLFNNPEGTQFEKYIKWKYVMQWGWLSDPFCTIEEQVWLWYEIMKFLLIEKDYPIRFSSKWDLVIKDKKYLDLMIKAKKNIAYMSSIITYDEEVTKVLEAWTPSPARRFEVLKTLSDNWIYTVLRLRPYIIGITNKTIDKTLLEAKKAGVKAISTEFFCLEVRANEKVKENYKRISKLCWFDIVNYYKNNANTQWYLRLSRKTVQPYIDELISKAKAYWIKVSISCPKNKHQWSSVSCCGLPENDPILWKVHKWQYVHALQVVVKQDDKIDEWQC